MGKIHAARCRVRQDEVLQGMPEEEPESVPDGEAVPGGENASFGSGGSEQGIVHRSPAW